MNYFAICSVACVVVLVLSAAGARAEDAGQPGQRRAMIAPVPAREPNAAQRALIERKYGMFCHFGINTYVNEEWTDGSVPPEKYDPPADLEQKIDGWVKTAHEAGMRYFLCITKHHDGFCMWDTKLTNYSVMNPKVKNHTDVVRAVSNACKKYDVKFAVYYSLWDRHEKNEKDPKKYKEFMCKQLTELMTDYGPVCELWLDGSWVQSPEKWYLDEVYDTVKRLQPDCQITSNWTITDEKDHQVKPHELKEGMPIKYFPSDFRISDPYLPVVPDPKLYSHDGKLYYMPYEATVTLAGNNSWFFHPNAGAKSVDDLQDVFEIATAEDNCLVLNLPPDMNGDLVADQKDALMGLAKRLNLKPGGPFPPTRVNWSTGATVTASAIWEDANDPTSYVPANVVDGNPATRWASGPRGLRQAWIALDFQREIIISTLRIKQYESRIQKFQIEIPDDKNGWRAIQTGATIDGRGEISLPPTKASKLRLNILDASEAPSIYEIKVLGE